MNGKIVDTNVIIRVLKGVSELFPLFDEMENLYVSWISLGELMYGAELSSKKDFNKAHYKAFCDQMQVIDSDKEISDCYAIVKSQLKRDGHPIPENDIWIAATAMARNLTLVTADKHFEFIKGISVEIA
ncbi:MAG: PIN domain-containing protein [Treponema sp.]|nr:PIN domain-containing protein [Candidatus Treponema equifaecale]